MLDNIITHTARLSPPLPLPAESPTTEPTKHVLFFGGRMNQVVKRINWIVDLYAKLFAMGADVEIVMTSPSACKVPVKTHMRRKGNGANGNLLLRLIDKCGRDQFLEEAGKATICVVASAYEAYPVGFAQIAGAGVLTLFPDRPWARSMMPASYPWFYKTEAEAVVIVQRALKGGWLRMIKQQLASMRAADRNASDYDAQRWAFFDHAAHKNPSLARGLQRGDIPQFVACLAEEHASREAGSAS